MELRHLRYFVAVANERNFTRAAERLHIAQPPLSRQIRQLEEDIGAELFDRDSRPLRLTEAGRLLYEQAAQVLAGVAQLRAMMVRYAGAGHRRFVIGFVGSTIYGLLPTAIRRFRAAARHVEVTLAEMSTLEQIAALKEGRIDVGFGRLRIEDPVIRRVILAEEPLVAALPADHALLATPGAISLAALSAEPLIVYPRPARPSYADQLFSIFHDHGLQPDHIQEARELQTAIGLVAAGAGLSIVPASVQRFQHDDIVYRPIAESDATSPIVMSHRPEDISPEVALLAEISTALYAGEGHGATS